MRIYQNARRISQIYGTFHGSDRQAWFSAEAGLFGTVHSYLVQRIGMPRKNSDHCAAPAAWRGPYVLRSNRVSGQGEVWVSLDMVV